MEMSESVLSMSCMQSSEEPSDMYEELVQKERDLLLAAELGRVLVEENESLKVEKEALLEQFKQKIHEVETERRLLREKLESAESDYEMQMQQLQQDVLKLRREVQRERARTGEMERSAEEAVLQVTTENAELRQELSHTRRENKVLHSRVDTLEESMCVDRAALREHAVQLETLRGQIIGLRAEQRRLEQQVAVLTAERDLLQEKVQEAEAQHEIDKSVMEQQYTEIQRLQKTTEVIQDSLDSIQNRNRNYASRDKPSTGHGDSLSDELQQASSTPQSETNTPRPKQLWWGCAWLPGQHDREEHIELEDDDSVLASMAANRVTELDVAVDMEAINQMEDENNGSVPQFVRELRLEVAQVYGQLRSICADLSFRHGDSTATVQRSTHVPETPEELAVLEMDFKLGSLKETLQELRGLLMDLELSQGDEKDKQQSGFSIEKEALREKMRQLDLLKKEKELYDQKLLELENSSAAILTENGVRGHDDPAGSFVVSHNKCEDIQEISRQEDSELNAVKMDIRMKKTEIERKMTRTKSEMEAIVMTTSGYFAKKEDCDKIDESWGKWPNNYADIMDDDGEIECD